MRSGPRLPARDGGPPRKLLVLLHGVGADGDADEVVPAQAMYAAVGGPQAAGFPVPWSRRRGLAHGIDPDSIAHGTVFVAAAFVESGA